MYSGRGILSQSAGPVWMIGTGEQYIHPVITIICLHYSFQLVCFIISRAWSFSNRVLAEHHVLYQYNLAGAQNHYMGLIQTETVGLPGLSSSRQIFHETSSHTTSRTLLLLLRSQSERIMMTHPSPTDRTWLGPFVSVTHRTLWYSVRVYRLF